MKFCKNLQSVMEISDPEWYPYWINYKHLKKLIKGIVSSSSPPAVPPGGDNSFSGGNVASRLSESEITAHGRDSNKAESSTSVESRQQPANPAPAAAASSSTVEHQSNGDETSERRPTIRKPQQSQVHQQPPRPQESGMLDQLDKSPEERAFFKLLHTEVKKSIHFFEQAQREYTIREERVRKGMEIIKNDQSDMSSADADERWSRCAQSIFRLYRELLLLETFAIMTYCGFSKILKKHDKNTGFCTRNAFMAKIVNQANFVDYPQLLQMINRCEQLYEEVSNRLVQEGKDELHEDQRLFIHMIHRLNAQVVGGGTQGEASASAAGEAKRQAATQPLQLPSRTSPLSQQGYWKANSLRELVAENDTAASRRNDDDSDDSDVEDAKQKATKTGSDPPGDTSRKRRPTSDGGPPAKMAKRQQN